ncbi:tetratricopeptide repeat protein [Candidatus Uabimicrobium sp. HlEnr_7]|uniref:protein kinase domain-containing protein n=1 Tax=Candidatus Uabimicrobium helgolandensis TaxID=3095367 RepID=UPI003556EC66
MEKAFNQLTALRKKRDKLISTHSWEKALSVVDEMIKLYPSPSSYTRQGMLLVKLNRYRDAIASFKQALKIDSDYQRAREILVKLSAKMDETCIEAYHSLLESNIQENKEFHTSDVSVTMLDLKPNAESSIIPLVDIYDTEIIEITPLSRPNLRKVTVSDSVANKKFGPYQIIEVVGVGGMGKVYKAFHPELDREIAIKVMHADVESPKQRQRFFIEAKLMAKLNHPSIASVYDVGTIEKQNYIVMDYIKGKSLRTLNLEKSLSPKRSIEIIRLSALAIDYAHKTGVIHRDLKPANIMVDEDTKLPVIMDFGLAKDLHPSGEVTKSGEILGTPRYMSPEQAEGKQSMIGAPTDVYSLGTVMYELLTQQPAVPGNDPAGIIYNILYLEVVPPRKKNPRLSLGIEAICLKCLEKNPKYRYQTAKALADDIERLLNGEMIEARLGFRQRVFRKIKARKNIFIFGTIFISSLVILAVSIFSVRIIQNQNYVKDARRLSQVNISQVTNAKTLKEKFTNIDYDAAARKQLEHEVEESITHYMKSRLLLEKALTIAPDNTTLKQELYHIEKEIGLLALLGKNYILSELSFRRCEILSDKEEAKVLVSIVKNYKDKEREIQIGRLREIMQKISESPPAAGMLGEYIIEIVRMSKSYIVRALIPYLKYGNKWQRAIAIESLGKIGDKYTKYKGFDVVEWLITQLQEENINLDEAEKIIWALGRLRDARANKIVDQFRTKMGQHSVFWNKTEIPYTWIPMEKVSAPTAAAYYERGKGWFLKGNSGNAIVDFSKAIELDPKFLPAYNGRGICYNNKGELEKAIDDYTTAISLDPDYVKAYSNRGVCFQAKNNFSKAISDYSAAITIDPNFHFAYANRAECYKIQNKINKAIKDYSKAIEISPPNEYYYTSRGDGYCDKKDWKKALADHATAIQINNKYAPAYSNRARCYKIRREFTKAIDDYSLAIQLNPQSENLYLQRALCYNEIDDYLNAINDCSIAIQINNKNDKSYLQRGDNYRQLKNWTKTMDDYNSAISLESSFSGYLKRAILYGEIKQYDMAIDDLRKCLTFENIDVNQQKLLKKYFAKFSHDSK